MGKRYNLAATEREIMEVLWEKGTYVLTRDLLDIFNKRGKNWKRQTLNTLVARLDEKGLVHRRRAEVIAAYTAPEFLQLQTKDILDTMYQGKFSNFCVALTGRTALEDSEVTALSRLIDELGSK